MSVFGLIDMKKILIFSIFVYIQLFYKMIAIFTIKKKDLFV